MELVLPSARYKDSFIEAVKEFQADAEDTPRHRRYRELSFSELEADFDTFVGRQLSHAKGENLPEGYVPETEYWLVDEGEFIGRISVRQRLTEHLKEIGGHIGYDIRPGKRGRGYGNAILALALPKAKALGIERVLVTCDATNFASKKIIEKNGGIFDSSIQNHETGVDKMRYWIATV